MFSKKHFISFMLVFIFTLLHIFIFPINGISAQNKEPPVIKGKNLKEDLKSKDEDTVKIDAVVIDKSNIETIGTSFKFRALSQGKDLSYQWILFKDLGEIHKKEYSKESFLDFTMTELGRYQAMVTTKSKNGSTVSRLSEEIHIVQPIKIKSVWVDKHNKQAVNTPLNFTVSAEGEDLIYHWYIYQGEKVVYDQSGKNNILSYTPIETGKYKALVIVEDAFGKQSRKFTEEIIVYDKITLEKERLESMINEKNFSSKTRNYMWVDTDKNKIYVFEGEIDHWKLIKTMMCTDGKATTPTVKGNFEINGRGPWLISYDGRVRAKYKTRFYGNYYFHSILFDSKGEKIVDSRLGKSLSLGCVRVSLDNAKWIYDNMDDGTGVYVK